jgi:hypothetical protein
VWHILLLKAIFLLGQTVPSIKTTAEEFEFNETYSIISSAAKDHAFI